MVNQELVRQDEESLRAVIDSEPNLRHIGAADMVINTLCIHSWEQLGIMQYDEWLEILEEVPQMRLGHPDDVNNKDLVRYGPGHMCSLEMLQLAAGEMRRNGELAFHDLRSRMWAVRRAAHARNKRHDRGQKTEGERELERESKRRRERYIVLEREKFKQVEKVRKKVGFQGIPQAKIPERYFFPFDPFHPDGT